MNAYGFDFYRAIDNVGVWLFWVFIEGWDAGFFGRIRSEDWGTEYCKGGFRMLEVVEGFGGVAGGTIKGVVEEVEDIN